MLDLVGHIGYVLILIGTVLLSKKRKEGWIFRFLGETTWFVVGLAMNMSSIYLWSFVFMAMDVFAYGKWYANEQATK